MSGNRSGKGRPAALAAFAALVGFALFLVFGRAETASSSAAVSPTGKWTCSMCPQFILPDPGKCPKCFMDLIPLQEGAASGGRLELVLTPETAALAGIDTAVADERESHDADDGGAEEPVLAVPASAVLTNVGRSFAYVESVEDEHVVFTMREVETGRRFGDDVEILAGLDLGDVVASRGVFRIDSAMQIMGKTSLANLPDGELSNDDAPAEPFMPAERDDADIRSAGLDVDRWFADYEAIRAALAHDDDAGAEIAALRLRENIAAAQGGAEPEFAQLYEKLAADAQSLAGAEMLEGRRTSFERLSGDMVLLARRFGSPAGGLNLIFCPMAFGGSGAHWLQPEDTVDNPYHGLEMPLCGWRVDIIPEYD